MPTLRHEAVDHAKESAAVIKARLRQLIEPIGPVGRPVTVHLDHDVPFGRFEFHIIFLRRLQWRRLGHRPARPLAPGPAPHPTSRPSNTPTHTDTSCPRHDATCTPFLSGHLTTDPCPPASASRFFLPKRQPDASSEEYLTPPTPRHARAVSMRTHSGSRSLMSTSLSPSRERARLRRAQSSRVRGPVQSASTLRVKTSDLGLRTSDFGLRPGEGLFCHLASSALSPRPERKALAAPFKSHLAPCTPDRIGA